MQKVQKIAHSASVYYKIGGYNVFFPKLTIWNSD